ncbi:MAG: hypothetical protein N3D74_04530 [Caldisericia bacterium]|nr:hypothetical protein [Caldisericia bacterium]
MPVVDERHSIRIVFGTEGNTRSETQNFIKPTATDTQIEGFVQQVANLVNDPIFTSYRMIRKQYG